MTLLDGKYVKIPFQKCKAEVSTISGSNSRAFFLFLTKTVNFNLVTMETVNLQENAQAAATEMATIGKFRQF